MQSPPAVAAGTVSRAVTALESVPAVGELPAGDDVGAETLQDAAVAPASAGTVSPGLVPRAVDSLELAATENECIVDGAALGVSDAFGGENEVKSSSLAPVFDAVEGEPAMGELAVPENLVEGKGLQDLTAVGKGAVPRAVRGFEEWKSLKTTPTAEADVVSSDPSSGLNEPLAESDELSVVPPGTVPLTVAEFEKSSVQEDDASGSSESIPKIAKELESALLSSGVFPAAIGSLDTLPPLPPAFPSEDDLMQELPQSPVVVPGIVPRAVHSIEHSPDTACMDADADSPVGAGLGYPNDSSDATHIPVVAVGSVPRAVDEIERASDFREESSSSPTEFPGSTDLKSVAERLENFAADETPIAQELGSVANASDPPSSCAQLDAGSAQPDMISAEKTAAPSSAEAEYVAENVEQTVPEESPAVSDQEDVSVPAELVGEKQAPLADGPLPGSPDAEPSAIQRVGSSAGSDSVDDEAEVVVARADTASAVLSSPEAKPVTDADAIVNAAPCYSQPECSLELEARSPGVTPADAQPESPSRTREEVETTLLGKPSTPRQSPVLTPVALSLRAARAASSTSPSGTASQSTVSSPSSAASPGQASLEESGTRSPATNGTAATPVVSSRSSPSAGSARSSIGMRASSSHVPATSSPSDSGTLSPRSRAGSTGSAVVLPAEVLAADVATSAVPDFALSPVTPAPARLQEAAEAQSSHVQMPSQPVFSPGSVATATPPSSSCGEDVEVLSTVSSSDVVPQEVDQDTARPEERPIPRPRLRRQSSFTARKMPDFAALHQREAEAAERRKRDGPKQPLRRQSTMVDTRLRRESLEANSIASEHVPRLPRASTMVRVGRSHPDGNAWGVANSNPSETGETESGDRTAVPPGQRPVSSLGVPTGGRPQPARRPSDMGTQPRPYRPRKVPTVPKPFNLPGDRFLAKAREDVERKRQEQEIADSVRVFKARPMPDFSKDPRM